MLQVQPLGIKGQAIVFLNLPDIYTLNNRKIFLTMLL